MSDKNDYKSPGEWVRNVYLKPAGISIKDAAQRLGVARQTFSAFLNGRITATPKLTARLEQVFGVSAQMLRKMQASTAPMVGKTTARSTENIQRYVPPYLEIRAGDLVRWADTVEARTRLAVLLRILIHSTGCGLLQVDFPGGDEAERPGWDGWVESDEGTPWIPGGTSGWEFGVGSDCRRKAEKDFKKRTEKTTAEQQQSITYVFVTLRRWQTKNAWADEKKQEQLWRDVRVYDASDLEQWLEQSLPGQLWLAELWQRPTKGGRTLSQCRHEWAAVTNPAMSDCFFDDRVTLYRADFLRWLQEETADQPFVIEAENIEVGLAFLACLASQTADFGVQDRLMVLDTPEALTSLGSGHADFVAVVHSPDTVSAWQRLRDPMRCIVIQRRGSHLRADVLLQDWTSPELMAGLTDMGFSEEDASSLIRQAGGSLTVLWRRLSGTGSLQPPAWMTSVPPKVLFGMAALGRWERQVDRCLLARVTGVERDTTLERYWHQLLTLSESPVWESLDCRGVVSKREMLSWAAPHVIAEDVHRFLTVAEAVLLEHRPLKLNWEDDEGRHELEGTRTYSLTVRQSLAETLVWLSIYGEEVFRFQRPTPVRRKVDAVVGRILDMASEAAWERDSISMPLVAEAAPAVFLDRIERGVQQRSATSGVFGRDVRLQLVNALACIAWTSDAFPRAVYGLAALVGTCWDGEAFVALAAVFCPEHPQTWASAARRLQVLDELRKRQDAVEWRLCLQGFHLNADHRDNPCPVFRREKRVVAEDEAYKVALRQRALSRGNENPLVLGDLLERLRLMSPAEETQVFRQVQQCKPTEFSKAQCVRLRDVLRRRVLYCKDLSAAQRKIGWDFYEAMPTADAWEPYLWLFEDDQERRATEQGEGLPVSESDQRLLNKQDERRKAVQQGLQQGGFAGVETLIRRAASPEQVGKTLATCFCTLEWLTQLMQRVYDTSQGQRAMQALWESLPAREQIAFFNALRAPMGAAWPEVVVLMPPLPALWRAVAKHPAVAEAYWRQVDLTTVEAVTLLPWIPQLVGAGRAWDAFLKLQPCWAAVSDNDALLMLQCIELPLNIFGRPWVDDVIVRAVQRIDQSPVIPVQEKERIEWRHLVAVEEFNPDPYDIPYLSRRIEADPALLWNILKKLDVMWAEGDRSDFEARECERARSFFGAIRRTPGCEAPKTERAARLLTWIRSFLVMVKTRGEKERGRRCVGALLGRSAPDGVWPAEWVADVVTKLKSKTMAQAMAENRCTYWRWTGVPQDEALARCRQWKERLAVTHPYVVSTVLEPLERLLEERNQQEEDSRQRLCHGEAPICYG